MFYIDIIYKICPVFEIVSHTKIDIMDYESIFVVLCRAWSQKCLTEEAKRSSISVNRGSMNIEDERRDILYA